jgi:hypothetical protein
MVVHIVMIKLKEEFNNKSTKEIIKEKIQSLIKTVPSLEEMEVGINFSSEERAMDLVLTAKFKDKKALQEYAIDPSHKEVIEFIKERALYTKVVDYQK